MGLLSIFKTKKPKSMDLPPPPIPAEKAGLPELPEIEAPPAPAPPPPAPELPEIEPLAQAPPAPKVEAPPELPPQISEPAPEIEPAPVIEETEVTAEPEQIVPRREPIAPLFVSTNDYQAILDGIGEIRRTLGDSENILAKLNEIKNSEEKVFSNWKTYMEDIERKISYVDSIIAKSQG